MCRVAAMATLPPPEDKSVTTQRIGNLPDVVTEDELRAGHFDEPSDKVEATSESPTVPDLPGIHRLHSYLKYVFKHFSKPKTN